VGCADYSNLLESSPGQERTLYVKDGVDIFDDPFAICVYPAEGLTFDPIADDNTVDIDNRIAAPVPLNQEGAAITLVRAWIFYQSGGSAITGAVGNGGSPDDFQPTFAEPYPGAFLAYGQFDTNPDTGLAWTWPEVLSATFSITGTGSGIIWYAAWVEVIHDPGTGGPTEGLTPNEGPEEGGTDVEIFHSGGIFDASWKVYFGEKEFLATHIVIVDPETITCKTPAHFPGVVDVVVYTGSDPENPDDSVTFDDGFEFLAHETYAFPFITSIVPDNGITLGGTFVTVNGGNFVPAMTIYFDGLLATSITYVSDMIYTCVTPQHPVGLVSVTMVCPV